MKDDIFELSSYQYDLPVSLIAQKPLSRRQDCRLLVVERKGGSVREAVFPEIEDFFEKGDCLVLNDTKVMKARLFGQKASGGKVELLLVREKEKGIWEALVKPAKRVKCGTVVYFGKSGFSAKIIDKTLQGIFVVQFYCPDTALLMEEAGVAPLPGYIKKQLDIKYYQTVYAKNRGAIAAPTAGFHFTRGFIRRLRESGVSVVYVTLHCGLGTFIPIRVPDVRGHEMFQEWMEVTPAAAREINRAKENNKKVFAVGTTCIRALESAARGASGQKTGIALEPFCGMTGLYITPGYNFKIVDRVITNFHTPSSTNLVLISAFCGRELAKRSYDYAIKNNFRFFSFGDAMIII